jgi:hypothetical protein
VPIAGFHCKRIATEHCWTSQQWHPELRRIHNIGDLARVAKEDATVPKALVFLSLRKATSSKALILYLSISRGLLEGVETEGIRATGGFELAS